MGNVLSFDKIQAGLDKIHNLATIQEEFEVYGMSVRIRTLTSDEQQAVLRFVSEYMKQFDDDLEDDNAGVGMEVLQNFVAIRKKEALAYSIMKIDDLDFEGVDYVETGGHTEEGVAVKVPKHVFLRQLIGGLDFAIVDTVHRKYSDLLSFSEEKAAEKVRFRNPEEELEKVEARRRELLSELGRDDELQDTGNRPLVEEPNEDDVNLAKGIRDRAFARVREGEAEALLEQRHSIRPASSNSQEDAETDEEGDEYPDSIEVAGTKFVRLDDPETPYTEDEQNVLEEQERLYNQKFAQQANPEAQDASDRLQKRRGPRQPLNQTDAQLTEGALPSEREMSRPTKVRKNEVDPDTLPLAEGYSRDNAQPLSRRHTQQGSQNIDEDALNPPAKGGANPNFKG